MDNQQRATTTDHLMQGLVKRIVLLAFGLAVSAFVLDMVPRLVAMGVTTDFSTRIRPMQDTVPPGTFVLPVVTLVLVGLLAYGLYDVIRHFLRYRRSRRDDQQMFP